MKPGEIASRLGAELRKRRPEEGRAEGQPDLFPAESDGVAGLAVESHQAFIFTTDGLATLHSEL